MQTEQPFLKPENQVEVTQNQVEQTPEPEIEFYFSPREDNVRRYSVAGMLVKKDDADLLAVTYVVCSDEDTFKKTTAKRKLKNKLKAGDALFLELKPEFVQTWKKVFAEHAEHTAPASVLGKKESWNIVREVRAGLKAQGAEKLPTKPKEIILTRIPEDQPKMDIQKLQEAMQQANVNLINTNNSNIGQA